MGRPFGIPVYVSPTWLIVAAFITYSFQSVVAYWLPDLSIPITYVVAFVFAVLLYVSVLLHELAHCVVARMYGLPVRRITLYLLGGVSEIEREPETPGREFMVAFAGALLSLGLAGLGFAASRVIDPGTIPGILVFQLWVANLIVGIFNLLPGLPLDGGGCSAPASGRSPASPVRARSPRPGRGGCWPWPWSRSPSGWRWRPGRHRT